MSRKHCTRSYGRVNAGSRLLDFSQPRRYGAIMSAGNSKRFPKLELISRKVTDAAGSSPAFTLAVLVVVLWLVLGPVFHYSDTWQLVINTGTTIITFLMVFLIQRSQNKDSQAVHLKLNEIVAAISGASNRLIDVEDLTEAELKVLHKYYQELALLSKKDKHITASHSIDEARERYHRKHAERSKAHQAGT